MSFTTEVIEEIVHSESNKRCCKLAEFFGFINVAGYLRLGQGKAELVVRVTKPASARRVISLGKKLFNFKVGPTTESKNLLEKWIEISFQYPDMLNKLKSEGLLSNNLTISSGNFEKIILNSECCKNSFLRGVFLSGGYILIPRKGRDLELYTKSKESSEIVKNLLEVIGINSKLKKYKHRYVISIRDYESIKNFLYRIGANTAGFKFEDLQAVKELKNNVNRRVNFERANIERITETAFRQMEAILLIEGTIGIRNLTPALIEAAELRLTYPNASLSELAEMMEGNKTKSAAYHRLRRIENIARKIVTGKKERGN